MSLSFSPDAKLLDGSFNNNRTSTSFGGKAMFAGHDAINLHVIKPVQPASKLLDNWFNGNSTRVTVGGPKPKTHMLMMPM
jgi:hypothetical protein